MELRYLIKTLRPRQWIKNLSLFAALIFGGGILKIENIAGSFFSFVIFCLLSSSMYILNDLLDIEKDKLHPFKKDRPIPSGKIGKKPAAVLMVALLIIALSASYIFDRYFFSISLLFIVIEAAYSLYLKKMIIIDALTVATAFIIRFYAGSLAIHVSLSAWLVLTTVGVSLLLAFGKRRSERTLLATSKLPQATRETLKHYPDSLLDSMISMSASLAIVTYAIFTFQTSPKGYSSFLASILPPSLARPKWMMLTIPFVIYGIGRYLYVIYEKKEGESPERVLLSDKPLLLTLLIWVIAVILVIYGLGD